MPIYEYECRACHHQFELLVLPQHKDAPACPSCQSHELERLLSGFAVSSEGTREANLQAARKRYKSSANVVDKRMSHLTEDYGIDFSKKPSNPPTGQK